MAQSIHTYHLSAERTEPDETRRSHALILGEKSVREVLDHVPCFLLLLDRNRQVVFANKAAAKTLEMPDPDELLGGRFGEAWGCVHSLEMPGGCGTSEACRYCGAASALVKGGAGQLAEEECRLMIRRDGRDQAVDLRVWARPIDIAGESFLLFAADDIAAEKHKTFMERIFLHDILNTAAALKGFVNLMGMENVSLSRTEMVRRIGILTDLIVDEINGQRTLLAAENNQLELQVRPVGSREVLEAVLGTHGGLDAPERRRMVIASDCVDVELVTDPALLGRVVGNMAKNAMEASRAGETVTLGCRLDGERVVFWVHNPEVMTEEVRSQVFCRSFSTKGAGRGLGTYSMKFLSEHYLNGRVAFSSQDGDGTTFIANYPRVLTF